MIYYPDRWVMVKIASPEHGTVYKILASWYGGFAGSDSWKLSSGTTKVSRTAQHLCFDQFTGSRYDCGFHNYGTSMYTAGVYSSWKKDMIQKYSDVVLEILPESTNWESLSYE